MAIASKNIFYAKSLEEDFATKTVSGNGKIICQTVENMLRTKSIAPNTKSFGREKRLSCTVLSEAYLKTYRPQGIIFKTTQKPDYVIPFDLVVLTASENIMVHYYRIKHNLHIYYRQELIAGFKRFIFRDFRAMVRKCSSPQTSWEMVNDFREAHGFNKLEKQKFRLVEYNEAVFHQSIKIEPVAIFGYRPEAAAIAKKLGLPRYRTAREFYRENASDRES